MVSRFQEDMTLQDAVRQCPRGASVLRRLGIAPEGTSTLVEAASKEGVPMGLLLAMLNEAASAMAATDQFDDDQFQAALQGAIIEYIVERYHGPLRSELDRLDDLFSGVSETCHEDEGNVLLALRMVFMTFTRQIEEHLAIEEEILFPRLHRSRRCPGSRGPSTKACCGGGTPVIAIKEMEREHELLERNFNEMRELTCDFTPSHKASEIVTTLYERILRLETELYEHASLENDLLWPVHLADEGTSYGVSPAGTMTSSADEEDSLCPRTNRPCQAGPAAVCSRFWDCLRESMEQRWGKMEDGNRIG
ncbi:hypothetical protein LCGC14_1002460 [marine sediment metagenome]|uniref:Uncharacterized protein n=1 Tax=marine sediment metagenome TaxID=412755 RepID=A0A0F9N7F1_9ZZZZ|nr:hypothetical protein [Phycisphaerae bacterium]HDZ45177.1 hypothetical protein [Phycisphaerae bacterium]